jgi:multidrug resistance efflux pump
MRIIAPLAVLTAAGVLGWLYWRQHQPAPLVVSGFIEADEIRVGSRVGGRVAEVFVREGQRVAAASPLFRLDPFDLQETLAEAEARLAAARAERDRFRAGFRPEEVAQARARRDRAAAALERLIAGPRAREIEAARAELARAEADWRWAESEHQRLAALQRKADAAPTEFNAAIRALNAARATMSAAESKLALLEEGSRTEEVAEARAILADAEQGLQLAEQGYRAEDVAQAEARTAAAEASAAAIRIRLAETVVASPCDCVVEVIDLQPGDLVPANAPSLSLLDLTRLWVRAYVPEARLSRLRPGVRVPVRVDGFPGRRFTGTVSVIAREGEFTPRNIQTPEERGRQVFRIKVVLETGGEPLHVGLAADVLLDEAAGP